MNEDLVRFYESSQPLRNVEYCDLPQPTETHSAQMNTYVKTEHKGYFSRIANSFIAALFGLLMVPGSVVLISWNEYRTVHRARGLEEAEKVVVEVPSIDQVQTELNDQLVHLQGHANTEETLKDRNFNISKNAIRFRREVEMYQWVERRDTKTRDKIGGGQETITTFEYNKRWEKNRVASERFEQQIGHQNPEEKFKGETIDAVKVNVGAYQLSPSLVQSMSRWQAADIDPETCLETIPEAERKHLKIDGQQIYYSVSPEGSSLFPGIGDQRIRFSFVVPSDVSVLAAQKGEQLTPFKTSNGEEIESLEEGNVTAADMFKTLKNRNSMIAWLLRGLGWGVASLGFLLIMGPLSTMASVIPFLGRITGAATFGVSVVLGAIVALVTIGIAWIAVRPVLAGILFAVAAVGLYLLFRSRGTAKPAPEQFTVE